MITPAKEYWETWTGGIYTPEQIMIEFARFHVKAALEAAAEKATMGYSDFDIATGGKGAMEGYISKSSILNAYPLTNIK